MQIVGTELTVMFLSKMQMCFFTINCYCHTHHRTFNELSVFDYSCHNFLNIWGGGNYLVQTTSEVLLKKINSFSLSLSKLPHPHNTRN